MLELIISIILILSVLTLVMFCLLNHIVKEINKQSKEYFTLKLQDYDSLIEAKEEKLKSIKEEEKRVKEDSSVQNELLDEKTKTVVVADKNLEYQFDNLFTTIKQIDNKFQIDEEEVIKKFLEFKTSDKNNKVYAELHKIKEAIKKEGVYTLVVKENANELIAKMIKNCSTTCKNIINEYLLENEEIFIDEFLSYIELEEVKYNPTVVVAVGNKNINYDYLSKNIKTIYDPKIYKGIKIIYQGTMYDYSLN